MHKMIRKCTWDCMNQSRSYSIDGNLNILSFNCINRYTICCLGDLRYDRAAAAVVTASSSQKSSTFLPPPLLTMPHCLKITKKVSLDNIARKMASPHDAFWLFLGRKFIHLIIVFSCENQIRLFWMIFNHCECFWFCWDVELLTMWDVSRFLAPF